LKLELLSVFLLKYFRARTHFSPAINFPCYIILCAIAQANYFLFFSLFSSILIFQHFFLQSTSIIEEKQILSNHQFGFRGNHSTLEQSHRVVNEIRKTLETKKFSPEVFFDLEQAFDRVWFEGLLHRVSR